LKRRDLLRAVTVLPLLSRGVAAPLALTNSSKRPATGAALRRVRPSDPAWPSTASWDRLKQDVGGSLIKVVPLFATCATEPKGAECLEALENARNPFYLGDQPAGVQVAGWLDAWTPTRPTRYSYGRGR
jgi:hypothetical protein